MPSDTNEIMRRLWVISLSALVALALPMPRASALTAKELVDRLRNERMSKGFRLRFRTVREDLGSGKTEVRQFLARGSRSGEEVKLLYQVLWPRELKGAALLVTKSKPGATAKGLLFTPPDKTARLDTSSLRQPFFGTDLTVEDMSDDFLSWPSQRITGEETVEGRACLILESRPGQGRPGDYSLVRSWIDPALPLAVSVEKYGRNSKLMKRVTGQDIRKSPSGHWIAARVVVQPVGKPFRTIIEWSKGKRDVEHPAEIFSLEGIREFAKPGPSRPLTPRSPRR